MLDSFSSSPIKGLSVPRILPFFFLGFVFEQDCINQRIQRTVQLLGCSLQSFVVGWLDRYDSGSNGSPISLPTPAKDWSARSFMYQFF